MTGFNLKEKPRVNQYWLLRNDKRYIVAYKSILESHIYHVLSSVEAAVIPMFDGTNTLEEIKEAFFKIFDISPGIQPAYAKKFEKMISKLFHINGFLTLSGPPSPSVQGNKEHLIPHFSHYRHPGNRLDCPLSVTLAFTNRCQCNCIYCYAEKEECQEYPLEKWQEIFNEISHNNINLVDIGGGDIFKRNDALELLDEMVRREFTFFISTKSYISRDYAQRLYKMGIGRYDIPVSMIRPVQVSIDSAVPAEASRLVKYPGYLEIAAKTVANLVQAGISPRVKGIITSLNAEAAEGIVRHFADLGVSEFHFAQYNRSFYRHNDKLFLTLEQKLKLKETAEKLKSLFPNLNLNFQDTTYMGGPKNLTWEKWHKRNSCSGGRTKMLVKPNGDVTLCEQPPHNELFVVGNVFDEGIMGVWNSKKLLDFSFPCRDKYAGTVCFNCGEFDECHGVKGYCFRDSFFSYGTIYDAPPECPRQGKIPIRDI